MFCVYAADFGNITRRYLLMCFETSQEAEVACLQFLSEKTSLPLPKIIHFDSLGEEIGHEYILMSTIPGKCLESVWKSYDHQEKLQILEQIASFVGQLKQLRSSHIGAIYSKSSCSSNLFPDTVCVPSTEYFLAKHVESQLHSNFISYIRELIQNSCDRVEAKPNIHGNLKDYLPQTKNFLEKHLDTFLKDASKTCVFTFCHKDLSFRNILVDGTKVTGIIDWEWSGFFPEEEEILNSFEFLQDPEIDKDHFFKLVEKYGGFSPKTLPNFLERSLCYQLCDHLSPWVLAHMEPSSEEQQKAISSAQIALDKIFDTLKL